MAKPQLAEYAKWFRTNIDARVSILTQVVRQSPGYEDWEPLDSPNALEAVGRWLEGQVQVRPLTPIELDQIRDSLVFPVTLPEFDFTTRTYSLTIDIGMYWGRLTCATVPACRWVQKLRPPNDVDFGQLVVQGSGPWTLNPVRLTEMVARQSLDGRPIHLGWLYQSNASRLAT